jgi:DNA-binding LytR/AlgR family response regulator
MPRTMVVDVLGKVVMFNLSQLDIVTPTPHTYWSVTFIDVSQQTGAEMNPLSGLMEMKKFPVYDNGAYCFLAMDSVHYIQADGDYCKVFTGDKSYYLHLSLKTILQRYSSTTFCQVHKSFIVNLHHVSKVVRNDEGRTQVIFDNTSLPPVPVSRRRLTDLRNALALL